MNRHCPLPGCGDEIRTPVPFRIGSVGFCCEEHATRYRLGNEWRASA